MLDNQTRRELLSKSRQVGFPGSILDVFTAYEQGRDLIGEFQQQQQQEQIQQMSEDASQQSGMLPPQQQMPQEQMPQEAPPIPQGLPQGSQLPQQAPPPNTGLVSSTTPEGTGIASNQTGSLGGKEILATGGFVQKFTEDQYNKFSTHFPFSKEQRESIAHRATVENPDLTMVRRKKYVFGGLKYALGGMDGDPLKQAQIATAADSSFVADRANQVGNFYATHNYGLDETKKIKPSDNIFKDLEHRRDAISSGRWQPLDTEGDREVTYKDYTTYKKGQHRFGQRELSIGVLNTAAPMTMYDDRIQPQYIQKYRNSDVAEVPVYDKLAVTPWKDLSDKQKIKRLQQFGGSGTPYKDKASINQAIINLKNPPPPVPLHLDMKEASPLPLPKIDLKPQLQNFQPTFTGPKLLRSTINTPDGPKVRVADMNQRFVRWEHPSGESMDFENAPTGDWQVDFPATYQEAIDKRAQERLNLRRENEAKQKHIRFATGGLEKEEEAPSTPCPKGQIYDIVSKRCIPNQLFILNNAIRNDGFSAGNADRAVTQNDHYYKMSDYMGQWQNSPMYNKMLKEADPANYDWIHKKRLLNLATTPPLQIKPQPKDDEYVGGLSWSHSGQIEMFPMGFDTRGSDTHELSHSTDRPVKGTGLRLIPQRDVDYINSHKGKVFGDSRQYHNNKEYYDSSFKEDPDFKRRVQNNYKDFFSDYVGEPTEVRARLNVIRQLAKEAGLYDPFTQGVSKELYRKVLKNYQFEDLAPDFDPMKQLQNTFSDDEIIWMLNHVSEAPVKEKENVFRGRKGGFKILKKRK